MIYPSLITSRVRGIQVHNRSVDQAEAGMRTAVNFQGLEKASINRGEVISNPGALKPSYMLDVSIHFLKSNKRPIKNRARVRFHTGTSEILGILILLDRDELLPDETAVAQIRLDAPVTVMTDDRFVIRSYSPVRTIGGGQILNPIPPKHKRFRQEVIEGLASTPNKSPDERIAFYSEMSEFRGVSFADLRLMTNLPEKQLEKTLQELLSKKRIIQVDKESRTYIHANSFDQATQNAVDYLAAYHRANPLKAGMPKEELKSKFPRYLGAKLFNLVLNGLIKEKRLIQSEDMVHLAEHTVSLGGDQADLKQKILNTFEQSGLEPPYFRDIVKSLNMDPKRAKDILALLISDGVVVKTKDDLYFHIDAIRSLQQKLVNFLKANDEITTPQFKDIAGVSRKYLIPLFEYFDATNVTLRVGDVRKLRKAQS
jgi:selenocysteine-specific elongation factor